MDAPVKFAVIGAGVIGLSTALCLQKEFPSACIKIFADKIGDDTLSIGAGGIFIPSLYVHPDGKRVRKWCRDSLSHFLNILTSKNASNAGMQLVSGYVLSSTESKKSNSLCEEVLPDYRELTEKELQMFPPHCKNGLFMTTVVTDCRYYLPWMKAKFEASGGEIVVQHINSFSEIPDDYDIVVNCAGLGAKQLCEDNMMVPIRGQTIKVKAPWIKNFYYIDEAYIIPGVDYVTLGGVKDFGCSSMSINTYQKMFILDKCSQIVPSLKQAEIAWEWVGLRPFRPSVRVDSCIVRCNGKFKMIVNNYGHGGHGVTLSWGTALEATEIMKEALKQKEFIVSKL